MYSLRLPNQFFFALTLALFTLLFSNTAQASHAVGADLTYTCNGGGQYQFTLTLYRDCAGVSAPGSASIGIVSAQCGVSTSISLNLVSSLEVSAICPAQINSTTCNGGNLPGIEQYVYTGTFNMPPGCGNDWTIGYSLCCRNSAITNLSSASSQNIYVQATVDNTQPVCNNSPFFTSLPVPYLCAGQPFFYNHGAVDFDGDGLVYTLVNALTGPGQNIGYNGGFSPTNPMATTSGFNFDGNTGQMSFTPSGTQQAVVTVRVDEYRNGVIVGSVIRDLQLVVINCNNQLPTATGINGATGGGGNIDYTTSICAGFPLCFDIFSADADGNNVTLTYNGGIPGGSFTQSSGTTPSGTFCWTPGINDIGSNSFSIEVEDNACPIPGLNIYTYTVNVTPNPNPPVSAGPDRILCQGSCANLTATSAAPGVTYQWFPTTGLSCSNCPNPTACPAITTNYTVTAIYPDYCRSTDVVKVTVNPTPTVSVYPTSATICAGGSISLTAAGSATVATYVWQPGNLSGSSVVVSPSVSTTYTVTAYDAAGCPSSSASSAIAINPPPPAAVCNNIYVTPFGTGGGLTPTDPTSLANALVIGACNSVTIKMAVGTYTINNPISSITSYMTLEGGFDNSSGWRKTSAPGATTIYRSASNLEGPASARRLVGVYLNSVQYVRFQDITIQTANATGNGVSNYGVHMTACSNYNFIRTQVIAGNASGGANGVNGATAANGANGANGLNGSADDDWNPGHGGNGGGGGGGAVAGTGGIDANGGGCCAVGGVGTNGATSTSYRNGGAGGGGGAGGEYANAGGRGGNGGGVNGAGSTAGGNGGAGANPGIGGISGVNSGNGTDGTPGAQGTPGTHVGGFYTPGNSGASGTDGQGGRGGGGGGGGGGQDTGLGFAGAGNGGGGGGGGGQGGGGGTGATAGGAPFAVYLFNNGANGVFNDCQLFVGLSGSPAFGGAGRTGGTGGNGGLGGTASTGEIGSGGNGGWGGAGGWGGQGGNSYGGSAVLVYQNAASTAPSVADYNFNLSNQPVITATNISCTNNNITFTGPSSAAWNYGAGSSPSTGTGVNMITQYTTTGRKNITYSSNSYLGFVNMAINAATFLPDISTTATFVSGSTYRICSGQPVNFLSSTLASQYTWTMGGGSTPNTRATQNIFGAIFPTPGTYTISLTVITDCCGLSLPRTITLIVDDYPNLYFAGDSILCEGESTVITASGGTTYSWNPNVYISATTGPTVTFNPPVTTTYLVTSYNAAGNCVHQRSLTIKVNSNPVLVVNTTPASCSNDGTATVAASAGSGNYGYQWSDSLAQVSATATGLLPGTYEVTVTDNVSGCSSTKFAVVASAGAPVVYVGTTTNATCFGNSNGTAGVFVIGGQIPYTYTWSVGGPSSPTVTGLAAGTYTVTVNDANNCTTSTSVLILQPDDLIVYMKDSVDISCNGLSDGSARVFADAGSGQYQYLWNTTPPVTVDSISGMPAGVYTVTVTDAANCSKVVSVTLNQPAALTVTLNNLTDVKCNGAATGQINVTLSGGSGSGYTYSLNNGTPQATGLFTGLIAGNYSILMSDGTGCDTTRNYVIAEPAVLTVSATADSLACNGLTTARITVTAGGGTPNYQYQVLPGGPYQGSNIFNNRAGGTYTVNVRDANLCVSTTTVTVYEPALLTIALVQDSVDCTGNNTGSVTATVGGGSTPYQYRINNGTYGSSNVFSGLGVGSYTVDVRDAKLCIKTASITVLGPPALSVSAVQDSVNCYAGTDGSITVTLNGGVPPYQYSRGGAFQSSNVFSGLAAGAFTITGRDVNGCTATTNITVLQPAALAVSLVKADVLCNGDATGTITATVTGGVTPYQYSINGGSSYQLANLFSGLIAGSYTIDVLDANSCTISASVTLTQPTALSFTLAQDSASCNGVSDGVITITATGGVPNYRYTIVGNPAQLSNTFTGLAAGSYSIYVEDRNLCRAATQSITVLEPTALAIASLVQDSADCNGAADGSITVSATGGTAGYTYSLDATSYQASGLFSGLVAGPYTVTAKDANNCVISQNITVLEPAALTISLVQDSANCYGNADGTITVTAGGGTAGYTYSLDATVYQASNVFTGLTSTAYTVTVKDVKGCTINQSITVLEPAVLGVTAVQDSVNCFGQNNGTITATATGGTAPYLYDLGAAQQASNVFTGLTAGNYTVGVTDVHLCNVTTTITVLEPAVLTVGLVQDSVDCYSNSTGTITATPAGGTAPYSYTLNSGTAQTNNVFTGLAAGPYTVDVTDANSCTVSASITVLEPTALAIASLVQDSADCNGAADGSITVSASGGTAGYTYSLDATSYQASGLFSGLVAGPYTVTAKDANDCVISQNITVLEPAALTISLVQDSADCYGNADGTITVTAGGGTAGYTYSLDATTYQAGNVFTGLTATAYTVTVRDVKGCTISQNINVLEPAVLGVTAVQDSVNCYGENNGTITATATGGTAPYLYDIGGAQQASNVFTGLTAGNYTVGVTDVHLCNVTTTITVLEPAVLTVGLVQDSVDCNGNSSGTITATPAGGTAPYSYSLNSGTAQTSNVFTGLAAGPYTVDVTDANSCTVSASITVLEPTALAIASLVQDSADCNGAADGSITVSASGGTAGYTYSLDATSYQASGLFSGLVAGPYTVTAKDANNCVISQNITVLEPAALTISLVQDSANCYGNADGTITVTAGGGTAGYTYSLDATVYQASNVFTGLTSTAYTVTVKDVKGCTINQSITVLEPAVLAATLVQDSVNCFGESTGSITATATGGTSPYQYRLNGGTYQLSNTFTGLAIGSYTIDVVDAHSCMVSKTISVLQPTVLAVTAGQDSATCNGTSTGIVIATATGGVRPYRYSINAGATYQPSNTFAGLAAGPYTVDVLDQNNCNVSTTITVLQPAVLTISLVQDSVSCNGGMDGVITVTSGGGIPPYDYSINGGTSYQTSNVFTALQSKNYLVDVRDYNGCISSASINVLEPTQVNLTLTQTQTTCFGGSDGTVTVTGSGGTPSYTYAIDGGGYQTSNVFTGLTATSHTVTIRDLHDCINTKSITVTQPVGMTLTLNSQPVTCFGGTNGFASVSVSGGTPNYTYQWSGSPSTGPTASNLAGGYTKITVTDSKGCVQVDSVLVVSPTEIIITATQTDVNCFGGNNGSISLTVTGGSPNPGYTYLWSHSPTSSSISGLQQGNYSVTVRDGSQCTATASYTITQPTQLTVSATATEVFCAGDANGTATATASGGTNTIGYTYNWNSTPAQNTPTAVGLLAGPYTVVVTDDNGCQATTSVVVPDQVVLTASSVSTDPTCVGADNGTVTATANGGVGGYTYSWSHSASVTTSSASGLAPDIYVITITDANGCTVSTTSTVTDPTPIGVTLTSTNPDISFGQSTNISTVLSSNVTGKPIYIWSPTDNLDCTDCAEVVAGPLVEPVIYTVTIIDENGCEATDLISINVNVLDKILWAPNAITANGDGLNDEFLVYGYGISVFKMMIFDRWGEKLFESTDQNLGWKGYFQGKELNPGVYVYLVEVVYLDGSTGQLKGSVTLLR